MVGEEASAGQDAHHKRVSSLGLLTEKGFDTCASMMCRDAIQGTRHRRAGCLAQEVRTAGAWRRIEVADCNSED